MLRKLIRILLVFYTAVVTLSLHVFDSSDGGDSVGHEIDTSIVLMIPFRDGRRHLDFNANEYQGSIITENDNFQEGFSLLVAAALAIDDFNRKESSLVEDLVAFRDCPYHFSYVQLFDTERHASHVLRHKNSWLDASVIVGIRDNQVAQALATDNNTIPTLSHNAWLGTKTDISQESSHLSLGTADWSGRMKALIGYLEAIESPSAALLYAPGEQTEIYFSTLEEASGGSSVDVFDAPSTRDKRHLKSTLESIAKEEVRTIVVAWERDDHIEVLAEVADELGMTSRHYKWIFLDNFLSPHYVGRFNPPLISPMGRLLTNSRILEVIDPSVRQRKRGFEDRESDETADKLVQAIASQGPSFLDRTVRGILHEGTRANELVVGKGDITLQQMQPVYGTGFLYDSIIATGLAACKGADHQHGSDHRDGSDDHHRSLALAEVDFDGVTGKFRIRSGARDPDGLQFGVYYIQRFASEDFFWVSLSDRTVNGEWVLQGGLQELYIPTAARAFGLVMSCIAIVFSLASIIFIYRRRSFTEIRMSQPIFLYAVCIGSACIALSIVFKSFDDSSISDIRVLDDFCVAAVWFAYLGVAVVYMALFSKLWRIKKVMVNRKNQQVLPRHVILPFTILIISVVGILIGWTAVDPPMFVRLASAGSGSDDNGIDIQPSTMPFCTYHVEYQAALTGLLLLCLLLVFRMTYMTRSIPEELSDSRCISRLLIAHFVIWLIGATLCVVGVFITSWVLAYFGMIFVDFIVSVSSVAFLIIPKMYLAWTGAGDKYSSQFDTGSVHVSGLDFDPSSSIDTESKTFFSSDSSVFKS